MLHNFIFPQGMLYPDPHVLGGIAAAIGEDREKVATWLRERAADGAQMRRPELRLHPILPTSSNVRLNKLIGTDTKPMHIVDEFYLAALSREPTIQERVHWQVQLESLTTADQQKFLEDFVWGMLSCQEFVSR